MLAIASCSDQCSHAWINRKGGAWHFNGGALILLGGFGRVLLAITSCGFRKGFACNYISGVFDLDVLGFQWEGTTVFFIGFSVGFCLISVL